MKLSISKSKNAESFYITQSYIDDSGKSTSKIVRKLGTLNSLCSELNTDRDGVVAWAKEQVRLETEKYKSEKEAKTVLIPFHANRSLDYNQKRSDVLYKCRDFADTHMTIRQQVFNQKTPMMGIRIVLITAPVRASLSLFALRIAWA